MATPDDELARLLEMSGPDAARMSAMRLKPKLADTLRLVRAGRMPGGGRIQASL